MSWVPPAAMGTTKRTGRAGYACAQATRDAADSAAAPAVRCRNRRRGSFILNLPLASRHSITSSARNRNDSGILWLELRGFGNKFAELIRRVTTHSRGPHNA